MGVRDWFRRKPEPGWTPEASQGDDWTSVKRGFGAQNEGPILAPGRNAQRPINLAHANRAGHRQYVRQLATRQTRLNVVGFGRWRRHDENGDHHAHAQDTAVTPIEPRWVRRIAQLDIYRASKRNRSRRITP